MRCIPRARDKYGIFLPRTPSIFGVGTSHQEGQREEGEFDIQFIIGESIFDTKEGASIFINPLVTLGYQGENREVDFEIPPRNMEEEEEQLEQLESYEFTIRKPTNLAPIKNINPTALPNFRGLSTEDPDTFLFEFEVVCRTYDYPADSQNLKLFPSTLKGSSLRWFMILQYNNVVSWEHTKYTFMEKYRDYCKAKDSSDGIFKVVQGENESLEHFEERFQPSFK